MATRIQNNRHTGEGNSRYIPLAAVDISSIDAPAPVLRHVRSLADSVGHGLGHQAIGDAHACQIAMACNSRRMPRVARPRRGAAPLTPRSISISRGDCNAQSATRWLKPCGTRYNAPCPCVRLRTQQTMSVPKETDQTTISPPSATGPAGPLLEGKAGGFYLLSLLANGEPRGLPGTTTERVS